MCLSDEVSMAIVRALVSLGHDLGLNIVAEGIETAEQAQALGTLGSEFLQGYHFARPMPASEVWTYLQSDHATSA